MPEGQVGPDDLPRLGSMVGRYRLDALLGRGGMGVVFHALDVELQRAVAIKFLSPELAGNAKFRERFVRESRLAAAIEHPAIVPIYEAGALGDTLFIAMRYVPGQDLGRILRAEAPIEVGRTLALLGPVADALDAAHERGLIHRDVKPANVLVERDREERASLADFGLSRRMGDRTLATHAGPLGTIDYIAPEQVQGGSVDGRADQYALACIVVHCITGAPPFEGESDAAVLYAQIHATPPRVQDRIGSLPAALDEPLARALSKSPGDRFPDCSSFVAQLRTAIPAGPALLSRDERGSQPDPVPGPPTARRRGVAVAVSVGTVALMGLVLVVTAGAPPQGALVPDDEPSPVGPQSSLALREGEVIVFASDRDGDYDLYAVRAGDQDPRRLGRDTSRHERSPAVSPDGSTIAYVVGTEPSRDIWLMDIDGRRPRRLSDHPADETDPAWSPDGRRLAYATRRSDPLFDIWEMSERDGRLDPATARNLTDRAALEHDPSWIPGGTDLIIASNRLGGNRDIWRIAASDPDDLRQLTGTDAFDFGPEVAPSARTVAFYRRDFCPDCLNDRGQGDLMLMSVSGERERRLTRTPAMSEIDPAWAPDERALVYATGRAFPAGSATSELALMSTDGTRTRRLTTGWKDAVEPTWGRLPPSVGPTPAASSLGTVADGSS